MAPVPAAVGPVCEFIDHHALEEVGLLLFIQIISISFLAEMPNHEKYEGDV